MAKLKTPMLRVVLADPTAGEDEGTEYTVRALNADLVAWDRERARYNWPKAEDGPFIWLTYLAHRALTRTGATTLTLAEFEKACLEVESLNPDPKTTDDEDDPSTVDPTQRAATPG